MLINTVSNPCEIDMLPDTCPFCHQKIIPIIKYVREYTYDKFNYLDVFLICPNSKCNSSFIAYYKRTYPSPLYLYQNRTSVGNPIKKMFSNEIIEISADFCIIYNEAYFAEQHNLEQICGVGYRKALEFLIKDYLIKDNPSQEEDIKSKLLGKCISEYVSDTKLKSVSKRAVWLGNDETHYVKKWEGKDLSDLKSLIDLTIHWIEAEVLTKKMESDMPEA